MNKYSISLHKDGINYDIFTVRFDKDGGYFISDLSTQKGKYSVARLTVPLGFGMHSIPYDKKNFWVTSFKPKLNRHIDGTVQVSNAGIKSGFFKSFKKPKGVATSSPFFNDGGPVFTFLCWGIEKFRLSDGKETILFNSADIQLDKYIHKVLSEDAVLKDDAYVFEGFHLPKYAIIYLDHKSGIIKYDHPNYGIIPLKYIPSPSECPGILAIGCRYSYRGFEMPHGVSFGGGAFPIRNRRVIGIQIIFPHTTGTNLKRTYNTLDFRFRDKVVGYFDGFISRIINSFR